MKRRPQRSQCTYQLTTTIDDGRASSPQLSGINLQIALTFCLSLLLIIMLGCSPSEMPEPATATPTRPPAPTAETPEASPQATPAQEEVREIDAQVLDAADASAPARLAMPELGLDVSVEPMGWSIALLDGERTTVWNLPEGAAGWHSNSALPGTTGNVVISGHQLLGDAVFATIALGQVEMGQEIEVVDLAGRTFVYRVTEVSEPVPISNDLNQERALAAQYVAGDDDAVLTLVAGWPDFSTTHRIFVRADYIGLLDR